MVVADIGLFQVIWTTLFILMLVAFVWLFIRAVIYLFHDELSGWAKAGVLVGLIIFPIIGSLAYLLARGAWITDKSAAEAAKRARLSRTEFEQPRGGSVADSTGDRAGASPDPAGGAAEERHDQ
jgi:hypothetical protein